MNETFEAGKESSAREARAMILVYYLTEHVYPGHQVTRGAVDSGRGRPVEGPGVSGGGFPVGLGNSLKQGCFESALVVLLGLRGSFLASFVDQFLAQKIHRFLGHLWWSFCMVPEGPEPRKWSSRVHETLIFAKSPVLLRGRF